MAAGFYCLLVAGLGNHKREREREVLGFLGLNCSSPMDLAHGAAKGRAHSWVGFLVFSGGCFLFSCAFFCAQALHATGYQEEGGAGGEYLATKINPWGFFAGGLVATFKS